MSHGHGGRGIKHKDQTTGGHLVGVVNELYFMRLSGYRRPTPVRTWIPLLTEYLPSECDYSW